MQRLLIHVVVLAIACVPMAACANYVPLGPSDAGSASAATTSPTNTPPTPTTPTPTPPPTTSTAVAYTDVQPIFASDCVPCHGGSRAAGRYSMTSYAAVMAAVRAGSASSALVVVTQPGGVMYAFLTGD